MVICSRLLLPLVILQFVWLINTATSPPQRDDGSSDDANVIELGTAGELDEAVMWEYLNRRATRKLLYASNIKVAKDLISKGADIEYQGHLHGHNALMSSILRNKTDLAKYFIKIGAQINCADNVGWTPLFHAIKMKNLNIIEQLICSGASNDVADNTGMSPFQYACKVGNVEIVSFLLKTKPKAKTLVERINAKNGYKAISYAVDAGRKKIVKLLLETFDADVTIKDREDNTLLDIALDSRNIDIFRYLQKHSTLEEYKAQSLFFFACCSDDHQTVSQLLDEGKVVINDRDKHGYAPLHYAVIHNNLQIAEILLQGNANIDILDHTYATPLSLALERSSDSKFIMFLLENGASLGDVAAKYKLVVGKKIKSLILKARALSSSVTIVSLDLKFNKTTGRIGKNYFEPRIRRISDVESLIRDMVPLFHLFFNEHELMRMRDGRIINSWIVLFEQLKIYLDGPIVEPEHLERSLDEQDMIRVALKVLVEGTQMEYNGIKEIIPEAIRLLSSTEQKDVNRVKNIFSKHPNSTLRERYSWSDAKKARMLLNYVYSTKLD